MFLPSEHSIIEKINRLDILKDIKETAPLYEYRSRVVSFINNAIKGVDESLDEDLAVLLNWFQSKPSGKYWMSAKKQMTPEEMAKWILANAFDEVEKLNTEEIFREVALKGFIS